MHMHKTDSQMDGGSRSHVLAALQRPIIAWLWATTGQKILSNQGISPSEEFRTLTITAWWYMLPARSNLFLYWPRAFGFMLVCGLGSHQKEKEHPMPVGSYLEVKILKLFTLTPKDMCLWCINKKVFKIIL